MNGCRNDKKSIMATSLPMCAVNTYGNKLTKLGDAIATSKSETMNDPLTDRGNC